MTDIETTVNSPTPLRPSDRARLTLWLASTAVCGGLSGMLGYLLGRLL
jgi:hypothetical protein